MLFQDDVVLLTSVATVCDNWKTSQVSRYAVTQCREQLQNKSVPGLDFQITFGEV